MHGQMGSDNSESEVIPFARGERTAPSDGTDQLDKAGQTILQMLQRAAGVAEENSRHALETAQKLSHQLRAAENRVAELGSGSRRLPGKSRACRAVAAPCLHGD